MKKRQLRMPIEVFALLPGVELDMKRITKLSKYAYAYKIGDEFGWAALAMTKEGLVGMYCVPKSSEVTMSLFHVGLASPTQTWGWHGAKNNLRFGAVYEETTTENPA